MGLRTGTSILILRSFLQERFGTHAWNALMRSMSGADRSVLSSVVAEGWYDLALHARLNRALCDVFYDGNLTAAEDLGRYSAEQELLLSRRWMARLSRPSLLIRNIDILWRQSEDSGSWTTEVVDNQLIAKLAGWDGHDPVLCRRLLGYMGRALEARGALTEQSHAHLDHGSCVFSFGWHLELDAPLGQRISSRAELLEVVQELAQFPDLHDMADAIVTLIHFHLDFPYVELWTRQAPTDPYRLVRTAGARGAGAPMYMRLQTGGRYVAQLSLEASPTSRHDLLQELAPTLGLPIDAASQYSRRLSPDEHFERRLTAAQIKWGLTARETAVLALLIRGEKYKDIGIALGCETGTVEQHVTHILRKSGAAGRNELSWKFWMEL